MGGNGILIDETARLDRMAAELSDQLASTAIRGPAASAAHSEVVNAHRVYDVTVELWRPPTVAWPRLRVLGRAHLRIKSP